MVFSYTYHENRGLFRQTVYDMYAHASYQPGHLQLNKLYKITATKRKFFCLLSSSAESQGSSGSEDAFDNIWLRKQKPWATSLLANQTWPRHKPTTTTGAFKSLVQCLSTVLIRVNCKTLRSLFVEKQEVTQARTIPNRQFECNHPVLGIWDGISMVIWNVSSQLTLKLVSA